MYQFKELEWLKQDGDLEGFYAEPNGLKWRYSILIHENNKIEFGVLDINYEYANDYPLYCSSIEEAQEKANNHYKSVLQQFAV